MVVKRFPARDGQGLSEPAHDAHSSGEMESLREQNRQLQGELTKSLEERNRLLKKLNQPAVGGRRTGGSRILEQRLDETRESLMQQKHQREAAEKRLGFLEAELARFEKVPGEFLKRLQGLEGLMNEGRNDTVGEVSGEEKLERTIDRFNAAVESIWRKLDRHDIVQSQRLKEKVGRLSRSLDENRESRDRLVDELERHKETIEELGRLVSRVEAERSISNSEIERLRNRIAELDEEKARLGESNLKLKQQVGNLKGLVDPDMFSFASKGEPVLWKENQSTIWARTKPIVAGLLTGLLLAVAGQWLYGVFREPAPTYFPGLQYQVEEATRSATDPVRSITVQRSKSNATASRTEPGSAILDALKGGGEGPQLLSLEGGSFTKGTDRYGAPAIEQPARQFEVRPFFMSRYEVTFDQYDAFARATGRKLPDDQGWGRGTRPVVDVTWRDARDYTRWLSQQTGHRYRLPTEVEWEYAMGAGSKALYWWGKDFETGKEVCFNCGTRWDSVSTAPVGSTQANAFGLYDMGGNVMEWVEDCSTASAEPCTARVVRGGAFNRPDDALRITARRYLPADFRYAMVGFRVVREP